MDQSHMVYNIHFTVWTLNLSPCILPTSLQETTNFICMKQSTFIFHVFDFFIINDFHITTIKLHFYVSPGENKQGYLAFRFLMVFSSCFNLVRSHLQGLGVRMRSHLVGGRCHPFISVISLGSYLYCSQNWPASSSQTYIACLS